MSRKSRSEWKKSKQSCLQSLSQVQTDSWTALKVVFFCVCFYITAVMLSQLVRIRLVKNLGWISQALITLRQLAFPFNPLRHVTSVPPILNILAFFGLFLIKQHCIMFDQGLLFSSCSTWMAVGQGAHYSTVCTQHALRGQEIQTSVSGLSGTLQ